MVGIANDAVVETMVRPTDDGATIDGKTLPNEKIVTNRVDRQGIERIQTIDDGEGTNTIMTRNNDAIATNGVARRKMTRNKETIDRQPTNDNDIPRRPLHVPRG